MAYYKMDVKLQDLKEGEPVPGNANGKKFAIVVINGNVNVLDGVCSHEGGPLGEGYMDNGELICPWHSGAFNPSSGKANENTPWVTDIGHYNVSVDQSSGEISIELSD